MGARVTFPGAVEGAQATRTRGPVCACVCVRFECGVETGGHRPEFAPGFQDTEAGVPGMGCRESCSVLPDGSPPIGFGICRRWARGVAWRSPVTGPWRGRVGGTQWGGELGGGAEAALPGLRREHLGFLTPAFPSRGPSRILSWWGWGAIYLISLTQT